MTHPKCPLCGTDGHRKDTPGDLYDCFQNDCRVQVFKKNHRHVQMFDT